MSSSTSRVMGGPWAQWLRGRLGKSSFVRHAVVLTSGAAMGQAMTILATPVLTRLYEPAAYGVFGLFVAFTTIGATVMTWRYELTIVVAEDEQEALDLLALNLVVVVAMVGVSVLAVATMGQTLAQWLNAPDLVSVVWWAPVMLGVMGVYRVLNFWTTRREQFGRLAISRTLQSGSILGVQIPAGLAGLGAAGLVVGHVVGQSVVSLLLGWQAWRQGTGTDADAGTGAGAGAHRRRVRWGELLPSARRYSDFALYGAPQALASAASQKLAPILLAAFFGPAIAGIYWLTVKLLDMPQRLINAAVRQVYFQHASARHRAGANIVGLYWRTTAALIALGLVPISIVVAGGPTLFGWVFGAQWAEAGVYARWLSIWWLFQFANVPAVMMVPVYRLQRPHLVFELTVLVANVAALTIGALADNVLTAIMLFSIVGGAANVLLIVCMGLICLRRAPLEPESSGLSEQAGVNGTDQMNANDP